MNKQKFFSRWWQGIKSLPEIELLKAKRNGTIGNIFGLLFAWYFLFMKGMAYFSILMFFILFLQIIELINNCKQIEFQKNIDEQVKNLQEMKI